MNDVDENVKTVLKRMIEQIDSDAFENLAELYAEGMEIMLNELDLGKHDPRGNPEDVKPWSMTNVQGVK